MPARRLRSRGRTHPGPVVNMRAVCLALVTGALLGHDGAEALRHGRLRSTALGAKKGSRSSSSGGFGAAPSKPKPAAVKPLQPVDETFEVERYPLPEGEGINTMFMGAFMIKDESVCDGLIAAFNDEPSKQRKGVVGGKGGRPTVDKAVKDSMEMTFQPNDSRMAWRRYVTALQGCTKLYVEDYPYAAQVSAWGMSSPANFQYYPPGGGYKIFHTERTNAVEPGASRHLVFMTYMNDVTDNGGTEFFHQGVIVQPKKGLTLVWPADWTFVHRGVPSETQEKMIVTGWFNFAA